MDYSFGAPSVLTSSPSTQSSRSTSIDSLPKESLFCTSVLSDSSHKPLLPVTDFRRPNNSYTHRRPLARLKMSGFLSSEAERVLMEESSDPQVLWAEDPDMYLASGFQTPFVDDTAAWSHAHSDSSGLDYFHPYPPNMPAQYTLPSQTDFSGSEGYFGMSTRAMSGQTPLDQSSAVSSARSAPSTTSLQPPKASPCIGSPMLQAGALSRSGSRSPSPHVSSDLQNYGTLNNDRRTWRCAYPGCHSKAIFVRPCDLRKHFHRHEKKFFCRYDGCAQSESGTRKVTVAAGAAGESSSSAQPVGGSGGFSSKKDRARHEAKHNPGVQCEWEGCERIFSRVDNMKDHHRRIHLKEKERRGSSDEKSQEEQ